MDSSWSALDAIVPSLRRFLGERCRDANELDDVVQETLLRAARHRATLSDPHKLRSWTFRIAINVLTDRVRSERRQRMADRQEDVLPELPCPKTEEEYVEVRVGDRSELREEVLTVLTDALDDLRDCDRRLLDSYYGGAGSCRETAADCGLPQELVKVHLFRARQRLRSMVTRRFDERRRDRTLAR